MNDSSSRKTISEIFMGLMESNADFKEAEVLRNNRDFKNALLRYQKVLVRVSSPYEKGLIQLCQANVMERAAGTLSAVREYKKLSSDAAVLFEIRAYAVEFMVRKLVGSLDPAIIDEVFDDEPYSALYNSTDINVSIKNLVDYGISLHPLAFSEFYSANRDAFSLLALKESNQESSEIAILLLQIEEKLKVGEVDLGQEKRMGSMGVEIKARALQRKAMVFATLSYVGVKTPDEVEQAYADTFVLYQSEGFGETDGPVRFNYARFLARWYGTKRNGNIQDVLKPLYTNRAKYASIGMFLKNARLNEDVTKKDVQLLASLDPEFKMYLFELGWGLEDF